MFFIQQSKINDSFVYAGAGHERWMFAIRSETRTCGMMVTKVHAQRVIPR